MSDRSQTDLAGRVLDTLFEVWDPELGILHHGPSQGVGAAQTGMGAALERPSAGASQALGFDRSLA